MKRLVLLVAVILLFAIPSFVFSRGAAEAEPKRLVVWAHSVHHEVARGLTGAGIDVSERFEEEFGVEIEWITLPWAGMQERILRELTAPDVEPDVVFINHNWADRDLLSHLAPLDEYMNVSPFEDPRDIPEGLFAPFLHDGSTYGVPYRITLRALHYNRRIFDEHGIENPPKTLEELMEIARAVTHTRADGARVYGFGFRPDQDELTILRAFGIDALTQDFEININSPEAVEAYSAARVLYKEGVIPPDFPALDTATAQELIGEGLIAMGGFPDGYYVRFNNPEVSREAGNMEAAPFPAAAGTGLVSAPSDSAIWGVAIPQRARQSTRDLAWEFIRFFSSKEAQLDMALNGNAPVRSSTYVEDRFLAEVPYGEVSSQAIQTASPALPTFGGTAEVRDIVREAAIESITGDRDVAAVLDNAAAEIERVLREHGIR
ncbi:MAG: sugar ABC transporter substrate-binding protein [Spirochaetaceae bacterium]|nr:MAG: sugar ABC transporter substrate-binding protein [Spirochaetaceae bacterium]